MNQLMLDQAAYFTGQGARPTMVADRPTRDRVFCACRHVGKWALVGAVPATPETFTWLVQEAARAGLDAADARRQVARGLWKGLGQRPPTVPRSVERPTIEELAQWMNWLEQIWRQTPADFQPTTHTGAPV